MSDNLSFVNLSFSTPVGSLEYKEIDYNLRRKVYHKAKGKPTGRQYIPISTDEVQIVVHSHTRNGHRYEYLTENKLQNISYSYTSRIGDLLIEWNPDVDKHCLKMNIRMIVHIHKKQRRICMVPVKQSELPDWLIAELRNELIDSLGRIPKGLFKAA